MTNQLILKYIRTILLSMLIFMVPIKAAYADVNIEQLQGVINGLITPQQVNEVKKQAMADRNETKEIIDPMTGSLTIKETDISLPGKDGLDLSIARIYNSSQAEIGTKRVSVTSTTGYGVDYDYYFYVDILTYNLTSGKWWTKTSGPYSNNFAAIAEGERWLNDTSDPYNIYYSYTLYYDLIQTYCTYYTVTTSNYPDKYNYLRSRYDLGAGWSLAFPSVEIEDNNGIKELFFHDGTGAVYRAHITLDTTDSNLENYQGKDVEFIEDDNNSYSNGQVSSKYIFIGSDRRETYFASDGRLIGVKDRFGNEIRFTHINRAINGDNYPFIAQIIDSIGRTINFTYENTIENSTSEKIFVTVQDPFNSKSLSIQYNKAGIDIIHDGNLAWRDVRLSGYTDPEGFQTSYAYDFLETKFLYNSKNLSGATASTHVAWLSNIWYPHLKSTYVNQELVLRNLGPDGAYQGYRVGSRYDQEYCYDPTTQTLYVPENSYINRINYQYVNDYTGYPDYDMDEELPESYRFSSEATVADTGLKSKTVFNGKKQQINTEITANNGEKKIISHQSFDANFKFKPTRTEIAEYSSGGTANKLYIDQIYNEWGGLSSETKPLTLEQLNNTSVKALYTTTYQYHPTYKALTERKWYQNNSTRLMEQYAYDSLGRIETATNPKGETTNYAYANTAGGEQVTITKGLENGKTARTIKIYGPETNYAYPTIIKEYYTGANGSSKETKTTKTYALLLGLLETETDNDGNTTTYTYDNLARITSVKLPNYTTVDGDEFEVEQNFEYYNGTTNSFDAFNQNLYTTAVFSYTYYKDPATGEEYYYDARHSFYDGFGNLRLQTLWVSEVWVPQSQYHFDSLARPNYFVDAEGNSSTYAYNPWGEHYITVDPFGNTYRTDYDLIARKYTDYFIANGAGSKQNVIETNLDQWGEVTAQRAFETWPNTTGAISESYTYDIAGNVRTYTNPNGDTTTYTYDQLDRLYQITDPLNQTTEYAYTVLDELKSVKQTDGTKTWTTAREYDELARLTKKITPTSLAEQYVPNGLGLLEQRKDPNQNTFRYTYDAQKREITKSGPALSFAYTYYNPLGVSWIEQFNNVGLIRLQGFGYNAKGQISYSILYNEIYAHETAYVYDKAGKQIGVQDPFSHVTQYGYDKNRPVRVQTNGSAAINTSDEANARYAYYPNGTLRSVTYPKLQDGTYLKTSYYYNGLNRLTKITNSKGAQVLSEYQYAYDSNGNITAITDAAGTTSYIYDKLDRLKEIRRPDGQTIKYTYDVRGNRATAQNSAVTVNPEDTDYTFNEWNQLTMVLAGTNSSAAFQYGPTGLRTKKVTMSETIRYHYNNAGQVVAESDASNNLTANYVWGPDRLLMKKAADGNKYYYLYNGHGDVIQIADTAGNIVNNYSYDEWGNILSQVENISNSFKYAGEIYDPETGFYYLRARYYDPVTGRFINKDPYEGDISNPLTLNLYTYAYNNPMQYIDPSGNLGFRQLDNLGKGVLASGWQGIKDIIKSPVAIYEIGSAIRSGRLSLTDLGKAIGASATEPVSYLTKHFKHVWFGKPTDEAVFEYGKYLGNLLEMAYNSGGKALSMISKASPTLKRAIKGAGKTGKGFNTFNDVKKFLGSPGEGRQWHHIVEQSQINKSGFSPTQIHNTNNLIAVDKATHAKISGYYSSKPEFAHGKTVRDWLAGKSYEEQYKFGLDVLNRFGVK
ncbi:RHS repeat-associated core domain-containing protein [Desulfoscipio sp. XC116]|uniref:RHS repeat-associated core domain-containing protein n=1 Tax=Desulfoscipio sp. XC116 TaxID=3144975 RepID=UPI00325AB9B3